MGKTKIPRDPNAPKRNLSAYLLYQNAMRDEFRAQNPAMTFGQLSKFTSSMYSELTAEEKHSWQARAEADKARYLNELAHYTPPAGYDANGNFIMRAQFSQSKKRERDPNAPKRNLSAYLLYQNAMREQFKRDNPGMTFGQLSKYTSHMYKSLTYDEKSAWEFRAEQDKIRYDEEMRNYVPPHGYDAQGNLLVEFKIQRKNSRKAAKDPNAPKRARGSYVLFTFDYRPKIMAECPGIKFTELGTVLGEKWRNLPAEERKRYDDMAQDDKIRFAAEMDVYKSQKEQQSEAVKPQQAAYYQPYPVAHPSSYGQMGVDIHNSNGLAHHQIQFHNMIPQGDEAAAASVHHQMHQYDQSSITNDLGNHHEHVDDHVNVLSKIEEATHLPQLEDQPSVASVGNHGNPLKMEPQDDNDKKSDHQHQQSLMAKIEHQEDEDFPKIEHQHQYDDSISKMNSAMDENVPQVDIGDPIEEHHDEGLNFTSDSN